MHCKENNAVFVIPAQIALIDELSKPVKSWMIRLHIAWG